eukprot:6198987-Pleurochrysis_carterae.AAC.2
MLCMTSMLCCRSSCSCDLAYPAGARTRAWHRRAEASCERWPARHAPSCENLPPSQMVLTSACPLTSCRAGKPSCRGRGKRKPSARETRCAPCSRAPCRSRSAP